jgi:carboxyl-terminal processing protease
LKPPVKKLFDFYINLILYVSICVLLEISDAVFWHAPLILHAMPLKKALTFLLLLQAISTVVFASLPEGQKLESLAKVWGFLKYHHPAVAKGKIDWDAELFQKIGEVKKTRDRQELSDLYSQWLQKLGKVKRCGGCDNQLPDSLLRNVTFGWLYDSSTFTPALINQLDYVRQNRYQGKNFYVSSKYPMFDTQVHFPNEKPYENLPDLPTEEYRLLTLFRHWNMVNYYFPYKYAIGQSWDAVLAQMLPAFQNAATPSAYHLAILELAASVNDGHAFFYSKYTGQHFGPYHVPFQVSLIDDKAVVTGFYNAEMAQAVGINLGDAITRINGKTIPEALEPHLKYLIGSNLAYKKSKAHVALFNGYTPDLEVTLERDGLPETKKITRYYFARFGYRADSITVPAVRLLNPQTAYIDMSRLKPKELPAFMKTALNTKAMVIDLRQYPKPGAHAVAAYLKTSRTHYALMTYPDMRYPGAFRPKYPWKSGAKNNKNPYQGKVVVLVNEGTMSAGEFAAMNFKTAPNVTVLGSQTAGADGNIVYLPLPGGLKSSMSGLGVYYPDGRETQRIGIIPDLEVKPTVAGIKAGKDEVLERALQLIETGK